jgi:hypothetical protein
MENEFKSKGTEISETPRSALFSDSSYWRVGLHKKQTKISTFTENLNLLFFSYYFCLSIQTLNFFTYEAVRVHPDIWIKLSDDSTTILSIKWVGSKSMVMNIVIEISVLEIEGTMKYVISRWQLSGI